MPIQTVASQRLYQQVAGQLGELIRQGEFLPGDRLPPERDLARQLGVSRPTVREAMIALEIAGLVDVRTGSGAYVRKAPSTGVMPFAPPDIGPSPFELVAARRLIEPEVAFAAAGCMHAGVLAGIAETLDTMRAGIDAGDGCSGGGPAVPYPHRGGDRQYGAGFGGGAALGQHLRADLRRA